MSDPAQIAQYIVERVTASQHVLGAKLGAVVAAQFPNVNFKAEYGGLRAFVQRFCGDAVKITPVKVGPFGQDNIYAAANASDVPTTLEAARSSPVAEESAWRRFTVPDSSGRLWVNRTSALIRLDEPPRGEAEGDWIEIAKSSHDEHRQIALDFLPQIDEHDRATFQQIVELPDFWRAWFSATRDVSNGRYGKSWAAFRFSKLCQLFTERLTSAGITQEVAVRALDHLRETKVDRRRAAPTGAPNDAAGGAYPSAGDNNVLRELARIAVESLSEDDLRRVWLPLGVISDAVRRREAH